MFAAGGLQDNGNVYTVWKDQLPWRQVANSDGQLTLPVTDTDLLYDNNSDVLLPTLASWDGTKMVFKGVPDVRINDGSIVPNVHKDPKDPNAMEGAGKGKELFVEAVRVPKLQSQDNPEFLIRAVAGVVNLVYGLFDDNHTTTRMHWEHWEKLGPLQLNANDYITALGSYNGQIIFAGTNFGRICWVNPTTGTQVAMDSGNSARISRILVDASAPPAITGFACAGNTVLQLVGGSIQGPDGKWDALGPVNAVGDRLIDIAVDWDSQPSGIFACTDTRVFASRDGQNWCDASLGLPEVPHCAGLQIAGGKVFLGTFGRSMWSAGLMGEISTGVIRGYVTDAAGNPTNDASVLVGSTRLATDAQGFYTLTIDPGVYNLLAVQSGFVPRGATVKVCAGSQITLNFALEQGTAFVVKGQVTDTKGNPIPGAIVRLIEIDAGVPGILETTTDSNGSYKITDNPGSYNGRYSIDAFASGFEEASITIDSILNGAMVTPPDLVLFRIGILTGVVADTNGTPLAGALVMVGTGIPMLGQPNTFSASSHTDATANYSIMVDPPGAYNAVAAQPGFEDSDPKPITLNLDKTTIQNFALIKATPGNITGMVIDAETQFPIRGATVEAIVEDPSSESQTAKTNSDGTYMLSNVLSGRRQVNAEAKGYSGDMQTVKVMAGQTLPDVNFSLTALPGRGSNGNGASPRF